MGDFFLAVLSLFVVFVHDVVPRMLYCGLYGLFVAGVLSVYMFLMVVVSKWIWGYLVGGLVKLGISKWFCYFVGGLVVGGIGLVTGYGFWVGVWGPVSGSQFFGAEASYRVIREVSSGALVDEDFWRGLDELVYEEVQRVGARGCAVTVDHYGMAVEVKVPSRVAYGWNWATLALVGFIGVGAGFLLYVVE